MSHVSWGLPCLHIIYHAAFTPEMRADELMQRMFDPISRWILILYLVKLFLRHWREEFLATLNTQRKWREATNNLKVGDVVFVVWSKCSSQSVVVFPHQDEQVRVVQEAYPPNNTTVSIERRSPDRVLKRGAEDPELFVSSRWYPCVGDWN